MTQHTPAPWALAERSDALAIVDAKGNRLACLSYGRGSVSMKIESDANNANARLIISAPELLAALIALLAWTDNPENYSTGQYMNISAKARQAISHAIAAE